MKLRVLVVDDVDDLRMLVRTTLETDPRFAVIGEAANGREAVRLVHELKPDLVLLDVSMPVMDGIEAIPLIHAAAPSTRILMLTGFDERVGSVAVAASADAYRGKTADLASLGDALEDVWRSPRKAAG